jgi:hypothetical protein
MSRQETLISCPELPKRVSTMADTPAIADRNLEATTNISLKREPACFAFLSACSVSAPMPIDSINLDLASADYFDGRASLWAALEMRSSVSDDSPTAILGFDETFLRPFARALIEAATTRAAFRMTILQETRAPDRFRVVEYVTGMGKALEELVLQPFDNVVLISAATRKGSGNNEESLFQLPRTDSFLRAFARIAYVADRTLRDLLADMERLARRRNSSATA